MKTDSATIGKVASRSAITLFVRQSVIQLISLVASVFLARLLSPGDYGVFALVGFFMQFLTLLSDGGIAGSIIQQRDEPSMRALRTVFTMAQGLYLATSLMALPGALLFVHIYHRMPISVSMIYVSVLAFYLSSFRIVPAVRLERELKYTKLAIVETIEYTAYQITAVVMALWGMGVWSFIIGGLASRVCGLIVLYSLSPFVPKIQFDRQIAKQMLGFGMSLQLVDIIQFMQNALTPTFVAMRLGAVAVGYVNFANKVSSYPTYPLNVINRMMFPLLARIQNNDHEFDRTLHRIIVVYAIALFGMISILGASLSDTIRIIFSSKWIDTVILIDSALVGSVTLAFTSPIMAAMVAKGFSKVYLRYAVCNVCLAWAIGIPAVYAFGLKGIALLNLAPVLSGPLLLLLMRKCFRVRVWHAIWKPLISMATTTCAVHFLIVRISIHGLPLLLCTYVFTACCYLGLHLFIDRPVRREIFGRIPRVWSRIKAFAN